jgi:hypothetical protein
VKNLLQNELLLLRGSNCCCWRDSLILPWVAAITDGEGYRAGSYWEVCCLVCAARTYQKLLSWKGLLLLSSRSVTREFSILYLRLCKEVAVTSFLLAAAKVFLAFLICELPKLSCQLLKTLKYISI